MHNGVIICDSYDCRQKFISRLELLSVKQYNKNLVDRGSLVEEITFSQLMCPGKVSFSWAGLSSSSYYGHKNCQ